MAKDYVLKNISKSFNGKNVISGLDYTFSAGKAYCLMGESGSGKTTLLKILMGLEKTDSGDAYYGEHEEVRVSAVFQEDRLCDNLSAMLNIKMAVDEKQVTDKDIVNALKAVNIDPFDKKTVSEYSGGMARRVALVRAMLHQSDVVLLDEPFAGLDRLSKEKAVELIKEHINGRTLVIATHDEEDASLFDATVLLLT